MPKVSLSYSTLNSTIQAPHTYLNKQMGLQTFQTDAMKEGQEAHNIAQDHVSGKKINPMLKEKGLPTFELVERKKWDDRMRVRFDINEKYYFTGFIDGDDPKRGDLLELKFGKTWSVGEFARLVQWKLYSLGRPEHKKIWMVNAPRDSKLWMPETIKIFNKDITQQDKNDAWDFIRKGLHIVENIREEVEKEKEIKKEKDWTGRSRWCYYEGCSFCT